MWATGQATQHDTIIHLPVRANSTANRLCIESNEETCEVCPRFHVRSRSLHHLRRQRADTLPRSTITVARDIDNGAIPRDLLTLRLVQRIAP